MDYMAGPVSQGRPPNTLAGSRIIARNNSNTPSSAIPNKRNGSNSSQASGYSTMASKAKGQHRKSSANHNKNANIEQAQSGRVK